MIGRKRLQVGVQAGVQFRNGISVAQRLFRLLQGFSLGAVGSHRKCEQDRQRGDERVLPVMIRPLKKTKGKIGSAVDKNIIRLFFSARTLRHILGQVPCAALNGTSGCGAQAGEQQCQCGQCGD